jgi:hypothetical protein
MAKNGEARVQRNGRVFEQDFSLKDGWWIACMHVRLKLEHACDYWRFSRVATLLPVGTVNYVETLKGEATDGLPSHLTMNSSKPSDHELFQAI